MKTTTEFLDQLKEKHGLSSDYALAKFARMSKQGISNYRAKKSFFDDDVAERVAELLEIEPAYVIACAHAERAKNDQQRKIWTRIADRFAVGIMSTRRRRGFRDSASPRTTEQRTEAAAQAAFFCSNSCNQKQQGAPHARSQTPPRHAATARHH